MNGRAANRTRVVFGSATSAPEHVILRWKVFILVGLFVAAAAIGSESIGGRTAQAAATRTWTGAVSGYWSAPGNWSPVGAPVDGDSV
ncbi:MAG: hypothetical protein ABI782_11375, partial [Anaerolineaceae bacterium]